jgi:hypothetical protein
MIGWVSLWAYAFCRPIPFLGPGSQKYVSYYWSKRFPEVQITLIGLIRISAPWMPVIDLVLSAPNGFEEVAFIVYCYAIAHVYYFFHDVIGEKYSIEILSLPDCVNRAVLKFIP